MFTHCSLSTCYNNWLLKLPDLIKPFILRTDASGVGVAVVLLEENEGKLYPVGK